MSKILPSFLHPPLIETAISVQFNPVHGFSNVYLGLFWETIRSEYPKAEDAQPIPQQLEVFGGTLRRLPRLPSFRLTAGESASRLQASSADDQSMVQLQNGRLVFNWRRKNEGEYPRWNRVLPQFDNALAKLQEFLIANSFKEIEPIQWEVTYVNHLVRGRDWEDPSDWPALLPGVIGNIALVTAGNPESIDAGFQYVLPENSGRIYVELHSGFNGDAEIIQLQLTARGGLDKILNIGSALEAGHGAIVASFAEITGFDAHKRWERNV